MDIQWHHQPAEGMLKEAFSGNVFEKGMWLNKAYLIHYSHGWTICYPEEFHCKTSNDVEALKKEIEEFLQE